MLGGALGISLKPKVPIGGHPASGIDAGTNIIVFDPDCCPSS